MIRRAVAATASVMLASALAAAPAGAHQVPTGCGSNSLDVTLDRVGGPLVRNGDVVNYDVTLANNRGSQPCVVTGVSVTLTLPGPDGTPTGQSVTFPTADYAAGTGTLLLGRVPWTVAVNAGVIDAEALVTATGTLHDAPTDHRVDIRKTVGTDITQPSATLTATVSPPGGPAPLTVTTTYTVTNTSSTGAPLNNVAVRDDRCRDIRVTGGDTNGNGLLDVGEAWTYVCGQVLRTPGVFPGTATATADAPLENGRAVPIAPATTTVTVGAPVRGTREPDVETPTRAEVLRRRLPAPDAPSTRRDAPCLALPSTVPVRAGELSVVRVTVRRRGRAVDTALVQVTGPGLRRRTTTNARGVAILRVRPRRSGQLVIQTDQCAGADRVQVRSARRVVSRRVPRNTG